MTSRNKTANPLQGIYELSHYRTMSEKAKNIPPFPMMVDVELTNICDMRCVMCPTGNRTVKRKKGFMDIALYRKILSELSQYRTPVRFIRWGEPFLHRRLPNILIETKQQDVICHINTNGNNIDSTWMEFLITVGLDSIKFSFQGVSEVAYSAYRNSSSYIELLDKIRMLHALRETYKATYPYIQIGTTITNEPQSAVDAFVNMVESFVDDVYIGKTRDLQEPNPIHVPLCECPEVFDKLSVNWDGSVSACCGDYDNYTLVGDIKNQTLKQIWEGQPLADLRRMLLEYRHRENYLCCRCARTTIE